MDHFFDVGANTGQTFDSYLCKTTAYDGWPVWCFEPSFRHLSALAKKLEEVGSRFKTTLCPFGLYGRDGAQLLYEKTDPVGDSIFESIGCMHSVLTVNAPRPYAVMAPLVNISTFITANVPVGDKIVLKLDCEGSEYSILRQLLLSGLALNYISKVLVEWHSVPWEGTSEIVAGFYRANIPLERWAL